MENDERVDGFIYIQLDSYLRRLRSIEMRKPFKQRRDVPNMKELANVAGISPGTLSRITRGHTRSLNLDVVQAIFSEMWRRGFKVQPNDLLTFDPPKAFTSSQDLISDSWAPPPPPLTRRQHRKYPGEEFVKAYAESESTPEEQSTSEAA